MGQTQAQPALLPSFFEMTETQLRTVIERLPEISRLDTPRFLAQTTVNRALCAECFDLRDYVSYATQLVQYDPQLNKLSYACVNKKVPEVEFWRIYFSHQYKLMQAVCGSTLTYAAIQAQDDLTSKAVIDLFRKNPGFVELSKAETAAILARDTEDGEKLAKGIACAVAKGVLPSDPAVEDLMRIDVLGKSADDVASIIVRALGDHPAQGCILVLQGLSGTGKGTTVAKLQNMLPKAVSWSNGNLFRALTLLAVKYCETKKMPFSAEVLTPEVLAEFMKCLKFGNYGGKFDILIDGCGIRCYVSEVQNTLLKDPKVGQNIPTVAELTQGEVIAFAANATAVMSKAGHNVLMEGREQTLNYVRTPHRFELALSAPIVIGMRRAAQRMVGHVSGAVTPEMCAGQICEMLEDSINVLK